MIISCELLRKKYLRLMLRVGFGILSFQFLIIAHHMHFTMTVDYLFIAVKCIFASFPFVLVAGFII